MSKDYSNLRDAIRYCSGIGKCENCPQDFQCNGTSGSWYMLRLIADALDELEKRVEAVRCADCKYDERCMFQSFVRDESVEPYDKSVFFCADGKRKDGGQEE